MIWAPLWLLAAVVQTPTPSSEERLQVLARDGPRDALVDEVRTQPDVVRDVMRRLLTTSTASTADSTAVLDAAERLASAYSIAWRDSFLIRQVSRFRSWSPSERRIEVLIDSLRLAGNDALGRVGVDSAMALWRESVRRATELGDTAGMAAGLGNIGRGFYERGALDSAETCFARSRKLAEWVGDLRTAGNAIGNLASISKDRGDLRKAESLYTSAGDIRIRTGDSRGLAADENNRGLIAQTLGDLSGARQAYEQALMANRRGDRREPAAVNLINLANLAFLTGDYGSAARQYHEALALYRSDGNRLGSAAAWRDLGLLAMSRGEYDGAITALGEALAIYQVSGVPNEAVEVRRDLAEVRAATGDLQGALRELQRAEQMIGGLDVSGSTMAELAIGRGDIDALLNHPADADREYARAQALYHVADDAAGEAAAFQGHGYLLLLRQDYSQARAALESALHVQATADPRTRALTRLLIAHAMGGGGDTAGAHRTISLALDSLASLRDVVGEAAALGSLADLARSAHLGLTAESLYRRGLEQLKTTVAPGVSWPLHVGLAETLRSRGALPEAVGELQAAITENEKLAGRLPLEQRRPAYLADKWDAYAELAFVESARSQTESAFDASERMRARQMLDLLARGHVNWGSAGRDTLTTREQELRRRISDLTRRLEDASPGDPGLREPGLDTGAAVREALNAAQTAYAELLTTLQDSQPSFAHLVRGRVVSLREVRDRLAEDEALLEYLVTDSTTLVFVVTRDTAAIVDLGVGRHALASLVDFARAGVMGPPTAGSSPVWRGSLERLYQYLIDPVETAGLLRDKRTLFIAPHAELHYVPFAALVRAGPPEEFLIERYNLKCVPSASVWLRLAERGSIDSTDVLALAPRVDALRETNGEAAAIVRVFGSHARVLVGSQASKGALRAAASRQGIIHFATYGVLNKVNPLFSFVELSPGSREDGRLEVHDVFGLDLHARLIVLSACETGLGAGDLADVPAGDDWVGLVEAFLSAGASNVLATLWPVEDRTTAQFMALFYREIAAGRPESEALADAQRVTLRNHGTSDPFYWAGFVLNGSR